MAGRVLCRQNSRLLAGVTQFKLTSIISANWHRMSALLPRENESKRSALLRGGCSCFGLWILRCERRAAFGLRPALCTVGSPAGLGQPQSGIFHIGPRLGAHAYPEVQPAPASRAGFGVRRRAPHPSAMDPKIGPRFSTPDLAARKPKARELPNGSLVG